MALLRRKLAPDLEERAVELFEKAARVVDESGRRQLAGGEARYHPKRADHSMDDSAVTFYKLRLFGGERYLTVKETFNDSRHKPCGEIEVFYDDNDAHFTKVFWARLAHSHNPKDQTASVLEYQPGNPDIKMEYWEGFLDELNERALRNIRARKGQ